MDSPEENEETVLLKFVDMMKEAMPDKVISNFIFVAEVVGNDDNRLSILTSTAMTPWLATGMLRVAMDMVINGQDTFTDDEDNYEDM